MTTKEEWIWSEEKKAAPANSNALTSKNLDFDEQLKKITYTKPNEFGLPEPVEEIWFRKHDEAGKKVIIVNLKNFDYLILTIR